MRQLIIAEKPSVGRDLARVLGVKGNGRGFLEGRDHIITWCIGHLVELVEPHAYHEEWKRWSLRTLPMIPEAFRLRPVERTVDQFETVRQLLLRPDVDRVVNACDAGREGELIFRYVYVLAGANKPTSRLWISSMTDEAIKDGFDRLRPGADYDRLWDAARCRSEADWLVGLNATRAITVRARQALGARRGPLFSVGRVQTPTLAMVVARELEIRGFVPQDYWIVKATHEAEAGTWVGQWFKGKKDRFDAEADAQAVVDAVLGRVGVVKKVDRKKGTERPPFLFDLTTLQREANKRFGFSAAHTLATAQRLYETHKLLTYPRTDSAYLPNDMYDEVPKALAALTDDPYGPFTARLLDQPKLPKPKRVFDDKKVSDHHAIIPTPRRAPMSRLNHDEARLYDLVARRFIAAFYPDALFEKTHIVTEVEGHTFQARGKVIVEPGWREVMGWTDDPKGKAKRGDDEEEEGGLLPPVKKGDDARTAHAEAEARKTTPPKRYTEATLLAAMEGAGRLLDDEALAQAMKDSGLGTPATRAAIIETLLARGYLSRKGKTLVPEDKGIELIEMVPTEDLKSPHLTGAWEARLAQMARGEGQGAALFMGDVRAFVERLVGGIRAAPIAALAKAAAGEVTEDAGPAPQAVDPSEVEGGIGACPRCGGVVREYPRVFGCRGPDGRGEGCGFRIFRGIAGRELSVEEAQALLKDGRTGALTGFMSKKGRPFEAALRLEEGGDVAFDFPPRRGDDGPAGSARERRRAEGRDDASPAPARREASRGGGSGEASPEPAPPLPPGTQTSHPCPQCGLGQLVVGRRAWGCSRWREGCRFTIPFAVAGHTLTEADVSALTSRGRTEELGDLAFASGARRGFLWLDGDATGEGPGLTVAVRPLGPARDAGGEGDPRPEPPPPE